MKAIILILFLSFSSMIIGQNCETCNEALRKDIYTQSNNVYIAAKYLEQITENEYNELKRNLSSSASIPIPELGAIVGGSLNYDDFKKNIRSFNQRIESEIVIMKGDDYKIVRTSPIAYQYWANCMENCNLRNGVYIFKSYDAESYGQFKIRYSPAPRESDSIFCKITINSEDTTITQNLVVFKNGTVTSTYPRKFINNISSTLVSVNASQTLGGGVSYSDSFQSKYIKPSGLKILSLNYSYIVSVTKNEVGQRIQNCMNPIPREPRDVEHGHPRNFRGKAANSKVATSNLFTITTNPNCMNREVGRSCDNKWNGFFAILEITPSDGYSFRESVTYNNLKLEGPMAGWNWGQRCPQNDKFILDNSDIKQVKVWLHQDVSAHLEMTSYKDIVIEETAFGSVDELGKISFAIPSNKLNNYSINIRLSDGNLVNINPLNVNEKAYLNYANDKTIFTLKNMGR